MPADHDLNDNQTRMRMRRSLSTSTIEQYLTSPPDSNDDNIANGRVSSIFDDVIMPTRMSEPSVGTLLGSESPIATPMVI